MYNVTDNGDDSLTLDSSSPLFCEILRPVDATDSAVRRLERTKKEPYDGRKMIALKSNT